MSEQLPDCKKCGNTRKIQSGYMTRDCICMSKERKVVKLVEPPTEEATEALPELPPDPSVESDDNVAEKKKDITDAPTPRFETPAPAEGTAAKVERETKYSVPPKSAAAVSVAATPKPTNITEAKPKRIKRKTEIARILGLQMGYTERVIEAIMCEKHYQNNYEEWEYKYADIYVPPLATELPKGYDPTKWIPNDKARDAFREEVNRQLPNKPRKVKFEDLCDMGLEDDENVSNTVAQ